MDTPVPWNGDAPRPDKRSVPARVTPEDDANRDLVPTAETYAALQAAYDHFNRTLFGGALPNSLVTLQRGRRTAGYFKAAQFERVNGARADEVALNPAYFRERPLAETLATLVHEMTHIWQHRFGKPGRGRYHNREWATRMKMVGLYPSSTGEPGGKETGERVGQYIVPDGPFAASFTELMEAGFCIPWGDRREAAVDRATDGPSGAGGRKSGVWFKFVCPQCGAIARAKHGARLICGDDYTALECAD